MSANRKESQSVAMTCNSIDVRQRSSALNRAEQYRTLAEDVRTRAAKEPNPIVKAEWENLAQTYVRLAKQVDDGWNIEITYDPLKNESGRSSR
jgi:hypothetical protein